MSMAGILSEGIYSLNDLNNIDYTREDLMQRRSWENIKKPLAHRLILNLYTVGAILIDESKPYTLSSGRESGFYINLRQFSSMQRDRRDGLIGVNSENNEHTPIISTDMVDILYGELCNSIGEDNVDIGILVPHAAMNLAFGLHHRHGLPVGYAIKEDRPKTHGVPRFVHSEFQDGNKVCILDDVITSGNSIMKTVTKIHTQCDIDGLSDIKVNDVLVVVDRLQGGGEKLLNYKTPVSPKGVNPNSAFTSENIARVLYSYDSISEIKRDTVFDEIITI